MTFKQLKDKVRVLLGIYTNTDDFPEGLLGEVVYEAQREISRRARCIETCQHFDLVKDQWEYTLPHSLYLEMRTVEYRDTTDDVYDKLEETNNDWIRDRLGETNDKPTKWAIQKRGKYWILSLYPIPSQDKTDVMWVYYWRIAKDLSADTDETEIDARYRDLIVPYSLFVILRRLGKKEAGIFLSLIHI